MTLEELITKQQIQIEEQKQTIENFIDASKDIYTMIYGVGGPLNDNTLGFNKDQQIYLRKLVGQISILLPDDNE